MKPLTVFTFLLALFLLLFFPFWIIWFFSLLYITILGISFIYSKIIFFKISAYHNQDVIYAYCDEKININLYIKNNSPFPVHFIFVSENPGNLWMAAKPGFITSISGFEKRMFSYNMKSMKRGEYYIGPIIIKGSDPPGFFPWKKIIKIDTKIIVYPRVFPVRKKIYKGFPGGNIKVANRIYEDVTQYRSLREYIPGDDIRRINWKVSARLGALHTMEFSSYLSAPAFIILDVNPDNYPAKIRYHLIERAIDTAASLVYFFVNLKQDVGFLSNGKVDEANPVVSIRGGKEHAVIILEYLARLKESRAEIDILDQVYFSGNNMPAGTRIILISSIVTEDQLKKLMSFCRKGAFVDVFYIGDSANCENKKFYRGMEFYYVHSHGQELINV